MEHFTFFESYYKSGKKLPDEERLKLYDKLLEYMFEGNDDDVDGAAGAVWEAIRPVVEKTKALSEAGKRGGSKSKKQNVSQSKATDKPSVSQSKATDKPSVTDKDKDKEKDKENNINTYVRDDLQKIVDRWNRLSDVGIAQVRDFTDKRKTQLQARVKNHTADHIMLAIDRIRGSDFLCGRKTDWKATFDWFIKPGNITKILEGNYDNKGVELNGNGATKGWGAARDRELGYA